MRVLVLLLLVPTAAFAQPPDSPFLASARKREEATRSAEFVVKMKYFYPRGGSGPEPKAGVAAPPVEPPEDTSLEGTLRLVYDGPRGRCEQDGSLDLARKSAFRYLETHNDREVRNLAHQRRGESSLVGGNIDPPRLVSGMVCLSAPLPILLACRLPQEREPFAKKIPEPTGTTTVVDGSTCEGYRLTGRLMWADPNQDYAIKRVEETRAPRGEVHTVRYDIHHEKHPVVGWLPASWTITDRHPSGRLEYTLTATATLTHVGERFPDELFEFEYPAGSFVTDDTAKPLIQYVVGPNGEQLPFRENKPPSPAPWTWQQWAGVGFAVALLAGTAVWRVRAGRKRKVPTSPAT